MLAFHMQVTRAIFQRCVLQLKVGSEVHYQSKMTNEIIATIIRELTPSKSRRCQQSNAQCFLYEDIQDLFI